MPESRRALYAPWITAGVAGAVLLALLLVYFIVLRPDERHADQQRALAHQRIGQLTQREKAAMDAAAVEMTNLVTYSRSTFDRDYDRALSGVTGGLRSDVATKRDETLKAMTQGKFDLFGRVTHKALEEPVNSGGKSGYVVLVALNGYRSTLPDLAKQQNLEVTVLNVGGKWLASEVTYIGVDG
jgi:nitrogen fixation protein